jgi:hypothetical protein
MSDNTLVEGLESVSLAADSEGAVAQSSTPPPTNGASDSAASFIVNSYGGYSKKGYAPYNPRKKNQDALIMAEDPKTRSLFLCVMVGFLLILRHLFPYIITPPFRTVMAKMVIRFRKILNQSS